MSNLVAIAYGGQAIQSSLSNEQEAQLEQALDARGVAAGA